MVDVFLGIGGNLGNRKKNIEQVITLITEMICEPVKISSVYMSEPWGFHHSKYFANAVVQIRTELSPNQLLEKIKQIETIMKRVRTKETYEGRTMDVDILFYGNDIVNNNDLKIPHKKLHQRLFVLLPMNEIASGQIHPVFNKTIGELLTACPDTSKIRKV